MPDSKAARTGKAVVGWLVGKSNAGFVLVDYAHRGVYGGFIGRLITLNGMKASEEITEEQSRQLLFDVDHAYAEFFRSLSGGKDDRA